MENQGSFTELIPTLIEAFCSYLFDRGFCQLNSLSLMERRPSNVKREKHADILGKVMLSVLFIIAFRYRQEVGEVSVEI